MEEIEYHKIKVENSLTGTSESESCFFKKVGGCKLNDDIKCRYSGTEVRIPDECPLREGEVILKVSASSHIYERE